jgi:aromatic amino acid transport protein
MNSKSKFFGSTLIVAGTVLGGGILALPLISAATGFWFASLLLIGLWALMTCTALLTLEANLAFKPFKNNYSTMSLTTLGPIAQGITWLASLALLYSLAAAYISGATSLISVGIQSALSIHIPAWLSAVLFTVLLGSAVFWSTKTVDHLNRWLLSLKGILLITTLIFFVPHIDINLLARKAGAYKYLLGCAPIFLFSFGFHHIIPSITNYVGPQPKILKKVIILGATIPVCIYLLWLLTTFGILPLTGTISFKSLVQHHGSVGEFIQALVLITKSKWVSTFINGFSNVAMTTSFLGVTLGLFDFLADAFKRANHRVGRLQTALLTFIPPLIFAMVYPKGFIIALGYAAFFVAILQIILPALMVLRVRSSSKLTSSFRMFGGKLLLFIVIIAGFVLIALQIASSLHMLPILK